MLANYKIYLITAFILGTIGLSNFSPASQKTTTIGFELPQQTTNIVQSEYVRNEPVTPYFYFHSGLYFGIIIMLIIINIFFYLNLKESIYLYYVLLVFATNFVLAYHEGLLRPIIKNIFFTYDIDMFSHIFQMLTGYLFAEKFLHFSKYLKKVNLFFKIYIGLTILVYLGYFINSNHLWIEIADTMGVTLFLALWISSFFLFQKNQYAKILALGFGVVIIAGFIHIAFQGFDLPVIGPTTNIIKIGALLEAIILTYATTYRTKVLKEENEQMSVDIQNYISEVLRLEHSLKTITLQEKEAQHEQLEGKLLEISAKHQLTEREMDVLFHIAKGLNNKQISEALFVSVNTIKYHTRNIYEKLDIKKRTEITSMLI